jgi:hypothetical protein
MNEKQSLAEVLFIEMVNGRVGLEMKEVRQMARDALAYTSIFQDEASGVLTDTVLKKAQAPVRMIGCKACYGSGGKQLSPCKKCNGTGKVPAEGAKQ